MPAAPLFDAKFAKVLTQRDAKSFGSILYHAEAQSSQRAFEIAPSGLRVRRFLTQRHREEGGRLARAAQHPLHTAIIEVAASAVCITPLELPARHKYKCCRKVVGRAVPCPPSYEIPINRETRSDLHCRFIVIYITYDYGVRPHGHSILVLQRGSL